MMLSSCKLRAPACVLDVLGLTSSCVLHQQEAGNRATVAGTKHKHRLTSLAPFQGSGTGVHEGPCTGQSRLLCRIQLPVMMIDPVVRVNAFKHLQERLEDDSWNIWFEPATVVVLPPPIEISTRSVLKSALAESLASALSTSLLHPIDSMKTHAQAYTLSFLELISKLPQIGFRDCVEILS